MNKRCELVLLLWATVGLWPSACSEDDDPKSKDKDAALEASKPEGDGGVDAAAGAQAVLAAPIEGITRKGLSAIWGSGPDDVWAVGAEGTILHYDGRTLEAKQSITTNALHAVAGTGTDDVWFAGDQGVTLHWDGVQFTDESHAEYETLLGIWPSAPDDVWVVGVVPVDRAGLVRHWDGSEWTEQEVPDSASFWEVWASGPEDVWFVGTDTSLSGLVYRGDGKQFRRLDFVGKPLRGVWGAGGDDVWLLPYDSPVQHWDGGGFASLAEDDESSALANDGMLGTWGSGPDDVWAVGLTGTILHFDGSSWTRSESPVDVTLWSVWGTGPDDVWAAGGEGTLLRWNGKAWRVFATGSDMGATAP